jgi:hypothetical protein
MTSVINTEWVQTFNLTDRIGTPDLVLAGTDILGLPHAASMRAAFNQNIQGFLLVGDIPTIAFAVHEQLDRQEIARLHKMLWNQGLASLLVVHLRFEVRVYSLWQLPISPTVELPEIRDQRLVQTLNLAADALEIFKLIPSVESGHYFEEYSKSFDPAARIDATLLSNLQETHRKLTRQNLLPATARQLILQIIFIAYLEDRGIIYPEYFQTALKMPDVRDLVSVLNRRDPQLLVRLCEALHESFNGDVFHALGSFEQGQPHASLEPRHLEPIVEFREGLLDIARGQTRFWPYDFSFIPVELISAIYDRFLNEGNEDRRASGAYFTPRFLADLVVDQAWRTLAPALRSPNAFTVPDPACGSAIFLVRMFQKMVEAHRKLHDGSAPSWSILCAFLERLHGWDTQESAVRLGVFSLYVALLEQVPSPALRALLDEGHRLPPLLGHTLCQRDFFIEQSALPEFDLLLGNPPWVSRRSDRTRSAIDWCKLHDYPAPGGEIAWAFLWKAAHHLTADGRIALLLPAMGILLNHSQEAIDARQRWIEGVKLIRVINFADVCFQLFDGADRPTILALYGLHPQAGKDYEFEYWVPKAHRLLSTTRQLLIPRSDCFVLRLSAIRNDPLLWKKWMWATHRDLKLLSWLGDLPKLSKILRMWQQVQRGSTRGTWIIGQGFKPYNPESKSLYHDVTEEPAVTRYPFLDADSFRPMPTVSTSPWPMAIVHRRGFVDGFKGPHILIPQGIRREEGVLRAAYVEQDVCFQHSLQAIRFPHQDENRAKFLTAVLNSSLAAWYYFHTSANFGADRAKVHEKQLLELPFPLPEDLPDSQGAQQAQDTIIALINTVLAHKDAALVDPGWIEPYIEQANTLVFQYYGLTKDEQTLVEDGMRAIIPSMQPRRDQNTPLMQNSSQESRAEYVRTLIAALTRWMKPGFGVHPRQIDGDGNSTWIVLELTLQEETSALYIDSQKPSLERALQRVMAALPMTMSRNITLQPDLKVFIEDALYIVKPRNMRYWLRSTALNDADEIAGDLLTLQATTPARKVGNEHPR